MRRTIAVLALLMVAGLTSGQEPSTTAEGPRSLVLASNFDLDGGAVDDDFVMLASVIVSEKADYSVSGGILDVCREVRITVADTDIGVGEGALTVNGTDCLGTAKSCSWSAWTAGDDDGVKALTCTDGQTAYFKTITSATAGEFTAAADDETFAVGYTTAPGEGWPMYGVKYRLSNGVQGVDPLAFTPGAANISTSGNSTTVSGTGAFTDLLAGDMIWVMVDGRWLTRRITVRTSANAVVVNRAISIPTARSFKWQKFYFSTNAADQLWIRPGPYSGAMWTINVDANANTGGVVHNLRCVNAPGYDAVAPVVSVSNGDITTASAAAATAYTYALDRPLAAFGYCKLGIKFGTVDDADAAAEDISATVSLGSEEYGAQ